MSEVKLSTRQAEVARLVARGFSYKEIASETGMALKTVETHAYIAASKLTDYRGYPRHKLTLWFLSVSDEVPK